MGQNTTMTMIGTVRRAIIPARILLLILFALGTVFAKPSFAATNLVERPENELLILELYINETLRDRTLLGYLPRGEPPQKALLPLGALSRKLSFSIDVDSAAGMAQGWFIRENNVFQLDMNRQVVLLNGKEAVYPDGVVEAHYEDIYVRVDYLEAWFGLDILTDTGEMRVDLTSDQQLPYEAEQERLKRAKRYSHVGGRVSPDYSNAKFIPYKGFSLPSVIMQGSTNINRINGDLNGFGGYSLQTNGDLLNFGSRFVASGVVDDEEGHQLRSFQLTFDRQDPGRNLLGPLRAGSYSFGDVNFPDVPLAISRRRGRGVSVSSDSVISNSSVFTPEVTVIDGDGPIGWDAELYRNGYFVGFVEVGNDGRYVFEDVELIRGFNLFEIILYGPEGQKLVQSQRVVRGARMLPEGETSYDFALGQPETDFIPLVEDNGRDNAFGASGQFFHGLRKNLTVGASLFRGKDKASTLEEAQTAGTVSAISTFLGFRTQLQLMKATEDRSAYDVEVTTRFKGANLTVGHTSYDGFINDDRRIKDRTDLSVNRNFGSFSASARAEKITFLEETVLDATLSTNIKGVALTNGLKRTISDNSGQENFEGDLAAAFNVWDWRVRTNLDYNLMPTANERLEGFQLSALKQFGRDHSLRLNGNYAFNSDVTRADLRYTRQIDDLSVDFNLGGDTDNNYSAGITLRTALQADNHGRYNFVNVRDGNAGAVGLRAYVDENQNDVYDVGEKLLEGVKFRSNRGIVDDETDNEGAVFVRGLSESITRFSIDEGSLPSIYLKPAIDYVDVIPRAGSSATVDLAFTQLGEIDGFIYAFEKTDSGHEKGAPSIEVRLFDVESGEEVQTTDSEYDGYYVFSAIPMSTYRIEVVPSWGHSDNLRSDNIVVEAKNPIVMDVDFTLPPRVVFEDGPVDIRADLDGGGLSGVEPASGMNGSGKPGIFVQMGAFGSPENAAAEMARLNDLYAGTLGQVNMQVRDAVVKGKTYYRVLGGVGSRKAGKVLCKSLKREGMKGCNVIKM